MLQFHRFADPLAFYNYFYYYNLEYIFPLVEEYMMKEKDYMYLNKSEFVWTVVTDTNKNDVVAIYALKTRNPFGFKHCQHLSCFEVNEMYRGLGIGTEVLRRVISQYKFDNFTLFCEPHNRTFYSYVGFQPMKDKTGLAMFRRADTI